MNPEAQRVAIAEACGYKPEVEKEIPYRDVWMRRHPVYGASVAHTFDDLPDYLNDLNFMHEAIETLDEFQKARFDCMLIQIVTNGEFDMEKQPIASMHYVDALKGIHAKASQLGVAFLRTIGKWVEDEAPHSHK